MTLGASPRKGQQRTIALAWKLSEVGVITEIGGQPPVLLLDDVMSELDEARRQRSAEFVGAAAQTFVTTTNLGYFDEEFVSRAQGRESGMSRRGRQTDLKPALDSVGQRVWIEEGEWSLHRGPSDGGVGKCGGEESSPVTRRSASQRQRSSSSMSTATPGPPTSRLPRSNTELPSINEDLGEELVGQAAVRCV